MRCLIFVLILCFFSNNCESKPSEGFTYMTTNNSEIEKCMRPVEDTERYWVCKYFKSEVFTPAQAGLGYCTIAIIEGSKIRHECRREKPSFLPGQNIKLKMNIE
ncbi:uncharacterized protein LOC127277717 [Leptopilina boulardi]|uniref:uncharacterized protein LOC127277717 n=1 Tax=Leptopilina boulardi TaxID=63433 RepID=UPI0021F52E8B|nr:uncharacterized protein LOC127277717 [Leptopilina boulardi]